VVKERGDRERVCERDKELTKSDLHKSRYFGVDALGYAQGNMYGIKRSHQNLHQPSLLECTCASRVRMSHHPALFIHRQDARFKKHTEHRILSNTYCKRMTWVGVSAAKAGQLGTLERSCVRSFMRKVLQNRRKPRRTVYKEFPSHFKNTE
jgi:hypothetical protein